MASGEVTPVVSCVKQIPEHLLGFVQSQILHYVGQAKDFSAEIHETDGKTARLVFCQGRTSSKYTSIGNECLHACLILYVLAKL